jgi:DNA-directed RNA polymerase subunit omega
MPWRQDTMMNPPIEDLLGRADSKFTLVTVAARRARQINSYFNHLGEGLGAIVPPQVASTARKPLSIAFEEIAAGKITYERTGDDTGVDDVEEQLETDREWGPVGTLSDEVDGDTAGGEAPDPS